MENPFELIFEKLNRIEALLLPKNNVNTIATQILEKTNEVLNTDEAAKHLSLAKQTLYGLTSRRDIPHFKAGKKLYFKRSELDEWLTKHRVRTNDEIDKMATAYVVGNPRRGKHF